MSKKLCKDTEIKAFSHWHFEFSLARFWAVPVFWKEVWTIWSAYAMAESTTQPNLPTQKPSWRWRNISLFTFLAGRAKEQVLDKGIRQTSTKRVGSIIVCSAYLDLLCHYGIPRVLLLKLSPQLTYLTFSLLQLTSDLICPGLPFFLKL